MTVDGDVVEAGRVIVHGDTASQASRLGSFFVPVGDKVHLPPGYTERLAKANHPVVFALGEIHPADHQQRGRTISLHELLAKGIWSRDRSLVDITAIMLFSPTRAGHRQHASTVQHEAFR